MTPIICAFCEKETKEFYFLTGKPPMSDEVIVFCTVCYVRAKIDFKNKSVEEWKKEQKASRPIVG